MKKVYIAGNFYFHLEVTDEKFKEIEHNWGEATKCIEEMHNLPKGSLSVDVLEEE